MEPVARKFADAKQLAYLITLACYHLMHNEKYSDERKQYRDHKII